MTYCPLITQTLTMISVRCILLSFRSKTRRRATLLLPTWIYACQSVVTVNFALPLMTSVTIFISILQTLPFLSINIPSSLAYGVFISQLIRYARACSSYKCLILWAVRYSNKLLGLKVLWSILSKNTRLPSPECYTTFWKMTIYSDTLH